MSSQTTDPIMQRPTVPNDRMETIPMLPVQDEEVCLPTINELGLDLLSTTPTQTWVALIRPALGLFAYVISIHFGLWIIAPVLVFLIFVAVVTATHDVVHGTLGLGKRATEWGLFLLGAFLLESGHAYRYTHHQHHREFPNDDDPEGEPAKVSMIRAVLAGPTFLGKLWLWSFRRSANRPDQRVWLIAEALLQLSVVTASVIMFHTAPAFLFYVVCVVVGSWVYPLLNVHLPHRNYGDTPLTQTHTLRGVIIPAIFLELTYHLEHHLYPQVPSHNLAKLAKRLDPFFAEAGVKPWIVP